ncbi:hypothetical protein BJ508DRAFT_109112 [Ascobolus immersus RN42]|uniref:Uncharacterized protein n=1 Tax=Ascobolus immersus RN42 TaxID=1160509 RepID=A0A3N4HD05_ASCIM|nr:hypothetical protein BJ508DRAFT_109112 [Ascobolus immersus RN42]
MSLAASTQSFNAPITAPAFLFRRDDDTDSPEIVCTFKDTKRTKPWNSSNDCPAVMDSFTECHRGKTKEACKKACVAIGDDKVVPGYMKCMKDACSNHEELDKREKDMRAWFEELFPSYEEYCDPEDFKRKDSGAGVVRGWKGASAVALLAFGGLCAGMI